ncbi:DsbA family protein [Pedomonas mirosovicensis]|uniref:DsbA family protein n=1 Tax=Pedomonas mirosovicensis TaxID=2908641 RepID=UPI0021683EE5|nr:DsbA family protein [Pedomonas mirosovicensis]MCH8685567.1 DsbA family protein [Pedomonas mirosovicensis]
MNRIGVSLVLLVAVGAGLLALTPVPRAEAEGRVKTDFTPQQEQQIEALVRQYILEHPEIIPEAVAELQRREVVKVLETYRADIETPFPGAEAGNPKGDVILVEFFDFRCPFCRKSHSDLKRLIKEDPNLRVVFRDLPILDREGAEPLSRRAAIAALAAAKQGRYYDLHDALFSAPGRMTQETLVTAVREAGLDEKRLAADMNDADIEQEIAKNLQLAGNLGLSGTPTYVIGDQIISGAVDYNDLKEAVAKARAAKAGK